MKKIKRRSPHPRMRLFLGEGGWGFLDTSFASTAYSIPTLETSNSISALVDHFGCVLLIPGHSSSNLKVELSRHESLLRSRKETGMRSKCFFSLCDPILSIATDTLQRVIDKNGRICERDLLSTGSNSS